MYGDFSQIWTKDGSEKVAAECSRNSTYSTAWLCNFKIEKVAAGYIDGKINLTVYDTVQNSWAISIPVVVYATENATPDYWRLASYSMMPTAVDRSSAPLINHRVYFHLNLESYSKAVPLSLKLTNCDAPFAEYYEMFNNFAGRKDPFIVMELKTMEFGTETSLNAKCKLEIISMVGKAVTNIETKEIILEIPLYNFNMGEASQELKDKINDIYDEYIGGWWKIIGFMDKLFRYLQLGCTLILTVKQVVAVFGAIGTLFDTNVKALTIATGGAAAPAGAAVEGYCVYVGYNAGVSDSIWTFFDKTYAFLNCRLARPDDANVAGLEKYASYFGGGGSIIGTPLNYMSSSFNIEKYTNIPVQSYWNGRDSLFIAIATVCIPGIIYNLQKKREIECSYLDCLLRSMETGVPQDACDKLKSYEECKWLWGEILNLFPITALASYILGMIKEVLSNPLAMVGATAALICQGLCSSGPLGSTPGWLCYARKVLTDIGEIISNIVTIFDKDTWKIETRCDIAEDDYDKIMPKDKGKGEEEGGKFLGLF
jgi:hypothetical protein